MRDDYNFFYLLQRSKQQQTAANDLQKAPNVSQTSEKGSLHISARLMNKQETGQIPRYYDQ